MEATPQLKSGVHELINQVADNLEDLEQQLETDSELDTETLSVAALIADRARCDEVELAFYDGAIAAVLSGLSHLDGIIAGLAHMVKKQGLSQVDFYKAMPGCLPTDNGLQVVHHAAKRLRREKLWPWSIHNSRAAEIVSEAGL